ncbi:terminase gpA endonuclease subunit [Roseomonas sp. USHLN139]|uniref:terminase gpA endonuclease subunit n=1 Tax=Roseomonas sp. USHLN139 TaxID=3081298 RepID=UPI003B01E9E9
MAIADLQFASARRLIWEELEGLLPPRRASLADWTAANRNLSNTGGGYVGRWRHEEAPYLQEPMECLSGDDHLTVAVAGPGQSGKTEIGHNYLLYSIANDPADMLWYMQTDDSLEAHVKAKIDPMILAHDLARDQLGTRPTDDTLHFKRFRSMSVQLLAATYSNLINKSAPRLVVDEVDAYLRSLGDVKALFDVRRQTYGRMSKLLMMSHPDMATGLDPDRDWNHGIMAVYKDSDRRTWWWGCPHCNGFSSPNPNSPRRMVLDYPEGAPLDEVADAARLLCPCCGKGIEERWRREMLATGRWLKRGETMSEEGIIQGRGLRHDTAGFWIMGVMSPFILGGIGGLARAREKARREFDASGEDDTLRQVVVKQWGMPYAPGREVGAIDAQALEDRAEPALKLGEVPEGVRFITVSADTQKGRWEALWRGWGVNGESWIIDYRKITDVEPDTSLEDWLGLFDTLAEPLPLADGTGRVMRPRCCTVDGYGQAGVTERAYEAWTRAKRDGKARRLGVIDGRDAWNLLVSKGEPGFTGRLQVTYPDARADRRAAARGQVPVMGFSTNLAKDDLAGQLKKGMPGAGYVHLPADLKTRSDDVFEQLTSEVRSKSGAWAKRVEGLRNEMIDLMTGAHAAARLHGLRRINWDRPPAWADEWDRNPMVRDPAQDEAAAAPVVSAVPDASAGAPEAVPAKAPGPVQLPPSVIAVTSVRPKVGASRVSRLA